MAPQRRYELVTLAEIEHADGWSPIRRHLGIESFGINGWRGREAGDVIVPSHDEDPSAHEEVYLVISGRATFTIDGEDVDAPAGSIVYVRDPAVNRGAVAAEADTAVIAAGGEPGAAFVPRSWESNHDAIEAIEAGRLADAREILQQALERDPSDAYVLFNLACVDALLGETEPALEHLGAALSERPALGENAREDPDLDSLHGDPRFEALLPPSADGDRAAKN
ncbi:MAG TPA: tetratricopeptide repeat protein [Solirubrobacteraceae bacterium]|nr:tetratricopeptide repeat protein [Solirubrobacteraceae bacterium]